MDILYIAGGKDERNDEMLRYSLRSIDKFGRNVGRVFVSASEKPSFLSDAVTFVQTPRFSDRKAKDIMAAILHCIGNCDISDDFLYSSVDHFYVRETDFDTYPYYIKGVLPETCDDPKDLYAKHLVGTREFLRSRNLEVANYAQHCNTHFNRTLIMENIGLFRESVSDTVLGVEATCLMLNLMMREHPFTPTPREDIKIACAVTYDNITERIGESECFSILGMAMGEVVGDYIRNLFKCKSRYERE